MLAGSLEEELLGDGKGGGFPDLPGFPPAPRCWSPSALKGLVHPESLNLGSASSPDHHQRLSLVLGSGKGLLTCEDLPMRILNVLLD